MTTGPELPTSRVAAVVDAAAACPGVARVVRVSAASRGSGRQDDGPIVDVVIVARHGHRLSEVVACVRTAVGPLARGRPVTVTVDDVAL